MIETSDQMLINVKVHRDAWIRWLDGQHLAGFTQR